MKTLNIDIPEHKKEYPIYIGKDILKNIKQLIDLSQYSSLTIFTDSNVAPHYLSPIKKLLNEDIITLHEYIFPAGEQNKNLDEVRKAYDFLAEKNVDRKGLIINLGGGVISDMGGFVASTYLRGIDFINISTTIEGMVDASVGGKNGVNLGGLKNYIGTFIQPKAIIMDIAVLSTLPDRAYLQGFAEVIKHGLIDDKNYFEFVTTKNPREFSDDEIINIIEGSCRIKAKIIRSDEGELGARKLLNFGHTIGHAIETLSLKTTKPLFHGEAVAIGMVAEAKIAELIGLITEEELHQVEKVIQLAQLPVSYQYPEGDSRSLQEKIFNLLYSDKKNQGGKIKWTLLTSIGSADFNIEVAEKYIKEGINYILEIHEHH